MTSFLTGILPRRRTQFGWALVHIQDQKVFTENLAGQKRENTEKEKSNLK